MCVCVRVCVDTVSDSLYTLLSKSLINMDKGGQSERHAHKAVSLLFVTHCVDVFIYHRQRRAGVLCSPVADPGGKRFQNSALLPEAGGGGGEGGG